MSLFETGSFYPHPHHKKRIARYKENKKLFLGEHYEVFKHLQKVVPDSVYLSINLAGLICKKSADFLFGEQAIFSAGKTNNSFEQKALDRFIRENNLHMKLQQSSTGNAFRGDSFFKIRWGQKWHGQVSEKIDPFRVLIELQNPAYVFPEISSGDATEIQVFHIAYPSVVRGSDGNMDAQGWVLNVESHYPYLIRYRKFELFPLSMRDKEVLEWQIGNEFVSARRDVDTGVPVPLVVHIPNYALDDQWQGIDDLSEHKSLFDEINNRFSKIAEILDKHADPAIAVPAGVITEDEHGNPAFIVGRDKVFEVMGKDDVIPQYITWNGHLQSAFEEIDRLVEILLTNAEIPAIALGKGDSGTSGSSGLAIKFRMNSLLAKINRKRQFYDKGLKELLIAAQMLEHAKLGDRVNYEIVEPIIHFKDGLPHDDAEQANMMNIRTGGKPTISQKSALMRLDGLTEEQAEAELSRIGEELQRENEQAEKMFARPKSFQINEEEGEE